MNISARPWGKRSFWTSCAGMVIPVAALWASMDTGRSAIIIAVGAAVSAFLGNVGTLISEGTTQQLRNEVVPVHEGLQSQVNTLQEGHESNTAAIVELADSANVPTPAAVADPPSVGTGKGNCDNDS